MGNQASHNTQYYCQIINLCPYSQKRKINARRNNAFRRQLQKFYLCSSVVSIFFTCFALVKKSIIIKKKKRTHTHTNTHTKLDPNSHLNPKIKQTVKNKILTAIRGVLMMLITTAIVKRNQTQ